MPGRSTGAAWLRRTVVWAGGLALVASCLFPTDHSYLGDRDRAPLALLSTSPAYGEEGVARDGAIRFVFDQRVHPDSVGADTVILTRGGEEVLAKRRVDLLGCAVDLLPQAPLDADVAHRATVQGLRAVGGGTLAAPYELIFVTGDATAPLASDPPPTLDEITRDIFVPRCSGCHSGYHPPGDLDLSTTEAARAGLVGQPSTYAPGFVRVAPGRAAESYLIWKVLGLAGIWGSAMPPDPTTWPTDRACGTVDPDLHRLAAWVAGLTTTDATP